MNNTHKQQEAPSGGAKRHIAHLDGLRGFSALAVVLYHALLTVWPQQHFPPGRLPQLLLPRFTYGHYAVDAFIVLSGYCLMLAVVRDKGELRGGAWNFLKKRARRIIPPYYAALLVSGLLIASLIGRKTGTHWDISLPMTAWGMIAHVFMLQGLDPAWTTQINHALWSISVEWWIYFLFPALVFGWRRFGGEKTTGAFLLAAVVIAHFTPHSFLDGLSPQYIGLFALGAYGAAASSDTGGRWCEWRRRLPWGPILLVTYLGVMFFIHNYGVHYLGFIYFAHPGLDVLFGLWVTLLLIATTRPDFAVTRLLSWRPLVTAGTFAYSLYLVNAPLLQVIWQYLLSPLHLRPMTTFALLALVGMPLSVGASYLFFLAFERPFLATRKRETMAEVARDAVVSPAP